MIKIKFPDGKIKEYKNLITGIEIAKSISISFSKKVIYLTLNGIVYDLMTPLNKGGDINFVTDINDKEAIKILNHTAAHVFAKALIKIFPETKIAIGPAIENGFHYDFELDNYSFSNKDFIKIEKEMQKIISAGSSILRKEIDIATAKKLFANNKYKQTIITKLEKSNQKPSTYQLDNFIDLCSGPHLYKVGLIKSFKLLKVGGSYFENNKKNKMINRVYGTAWFSKEQLNNYLKLLEEKKERDHRLIGKNLKIFTFNEKIGKGLPIWLPNGKIIKDQIRNFIIEKEKKYGFEHIETPILGSKDLYLTSGHFKHYKENMFPMLKVDNENLFLRPMSCPHHVLVYDSEIRSYRDLPIRYSEEVFQFRNEASGALLGLERVRSMQLTDSHIFLREDQIESEIEKIYQLINEVLLKFKIDISYVELALHDKSDKKKYHNDFLMWKKAEEILEKACQKSNIKYIKKIGEAAFYGPKIDVQVKTALEHTITLATIQLDFLLAEKFNITYINKNGEKVHPIIIHRGLIGTYERFISILLEQTKGNLPLWLAPLQVIILPISKEHLSYANKIANSLEKSNIRVKLDKSKERISYKIREYQSKKIPFQIIIGDEEKNKKTITFRRYGESKSFSMPLTKFKKEFK